MLSFGSMSLSRELRRAKPKFSFRSFYVSTLLLCAFALVSLVSVQTSRYLNGDRYGITQKRVIAELDGNRLVKRDEEVGHEDKTCERAITNIGLTVPACSFCRG